MIESPYLLEGDTAKEQHSRMQAEPSNRASGHQEDSYHAVAGNEGNHTKQHGDDDAADMHALPQEDMEGVHHGE